LRHDSTKLAIEHFGQLTVSSNMSCIGEDLWDRSNCCLLLCERIQRSIQARNWFDGDYHRCEHISGTSCFQRYIFAIAHQF